MKKTVEKSAIKSPEDHITEVVSMLVRYLQEVSSPEIEMTDAWLAEFVRSAIDCVIKDERKAFDHANELEWHWHKAIRARLRRAGPSDASGDDFAVYRPIEPYERLPLIGT